MIGWILTPIKLVLFAVVVLVAAQWIRVRGQTISDHVAHQMARPELRRASRAATQAVERLRTQGELTAQDRDELKALLKREKSRPSAEE